MHNKPRRPKKIRKRRENPEEMNELPEFDEGEDLAAAAYFEMLLEKRKNSDYDPLKDKKLVKGLMDL